jgi:hypothetical protein
MNSPEKTAFFARKAPGPTGRGPVRGEEPGDAPGAGGEIFFVF